MQSYKLHSISEFLNDRHPYIDPEFNDRYDKSEVYHAVFDRSVQKLIEILLMPGIDQFKYRDALITLNEMVSHQEIKDEMITLGLVSVVSAFLHHNQVEIRREAVLLLGSLVSIQKGRQQINTTTYDGLGKLLFDQNILTREACGWCICRIVSSRDGVDILCKSQSVKTLIKSFLQYTEKNEDIPGKYIIYLLEIFTKILEYDNGIEFFIKSGVVRRMNNMLISHKSLQIQNIQELSIRINYLTLECLSKICANDEGKAEGIDEQVILSSSHFLDSPIFDESCFSTALIMNCTINLNGKKQCVNVQSDMIIKKLIGLLDTKNLDLGRDVKQTLVNIAEYPEGFLIITKLMANNIPYLDDLFGPRVVIALSNLLPKTSELKQIPLIPNEQIEEYKNYVKALCYFLRNYEEAQTIAIEETVKIEEKLIPFLPYRQLSDIVAHSLYVLCNFDGNCKDGLHKYLLKYGDIQIEASKNTLKDEIKSYKKLYEMLLRN